jgi:hypothetical protein
VWNRDGAEANLALTRHHPRKRVIQYSRDV